MAVTVGALTLKHLQAQPFGWSASSETEGRSVRLWSVQGLATPAQWLSLLSIYEAWRAVRITEAPTIASRVVGTTVAFSGSAYGKTWSNVACWFAQAPEGSAAGAYVSVSFQLVDAAQSLAVLLADEEAGRLAGDAFTPVYGTWSLGNANLTLLDQPEGFDDGPTMSLTATGTGYISGPLAATEVRNLRGWTTSAGWTAVKNWYRTTISSKPASGVWFPVTGPSLERDQIVSNGAVVERYIVSITLKQTP